MIYEYALDSDFIIDLLGNKSIYTSILREFKNSSSFAIANFPKNYLGVAHSKIKENIAQSKHKEQAKWQGKLQKFTELQRILDEVPKAQRHATCADIQSEHNRHPFEGILSNTLIFTPCRKLSWFEEIDCPFFDHPISVTAVRNQKDQSSAVAPLLQNASEIAFVDPYFSGEPRYIDVYKEYFLSISKTRNIRSRSIPDKIIIIAAYFPNTNKKDKKNVPYDEFKKTCEQFIDIKPFNITLEIRRIQEISGQQEIHDRYILTDIGGVKLGHGTDISRTKGTTSEVNISLLSNNDWKKWRKAYKPNSPHFNWSEKPIIIE